MGLAAEARHAASGGISASRRATTPDRLRPANSYAQSRPGAPRPAALAYRMGWPDRLPLQRAIRAFRTTGGARTMTIRGKLCLSAAAIGIAASAAAPFSSVSAQQPSSPPGMTVGQADLGGTVSGAGGPEAGV